MMTLEQFNNLKAIVVDPEVVIKGSDLENQMDRTLLWGYLCDRRNFHVYLYDGVIYIATYNEGDQDPDVDDVVYTPETHIASNTWYIPDKRLYPEACDYEFCKLLHEKGMNLPFTTFNEKREYRNFYGAVRYL